MTYLQRINDEIEHIEHLKLAPAAECSALRVKLRRFATALDAIVKEFQEPEDQNEHWRALDVCADVKKILEDI